MGREEGRKVASNHQDRHQHSRFHTMSKPGV